MAISKRHRIETHNMVPFYSHLVGIVICVLLGRIQNTKTFILVVSAMPTSSSAATPKGALTALVYPPHPSHTRSGFLMSLPYFVGDCSIFRQLPSALPVWTRL